MIFENIYECTPMLGYPTYEINNGILEAMLLGHGKYISRDGGDIWALTEGTTTKPFNHPFMVVKDNKCIAIALDLRLLVKDDGVTGISVKTRSQADYNLLLTRAKILRYWLTHPKSQTASLYPRIMNVYAKWISSSIAKRYALDIADQFKIEALSSFYYLTLFRENSQYDATFREESLLRIVQNVKIPGREISDLILSIEEPLTNINSFCALIKDKTENVRLSSLTAPVLITLLSSSWFGHNHKEMLAASIEHPPTFMALVYTALNETLYKKVGLAQVAVNTLKRTALDYVLTIQEIMGLDQ